VWLHQKIGGGQVLAGGAGKTWLGGFGWVITYKRSAKDQKKENGIGLMIACELGGDQKLSLWLQHIQHYNILYFQTVHIYIYI
jgi:hypothetical protein